MVASYLKYKKLIGAGCSFIQGCELGDENTDRGYSLKTYPALVAKHFNFPYECLAYGGASNTGIANMLLNNDIQDAIILVQWTYESRVGMHINVKNNPLHKNGSKWFDFAPGNWLFDPTRFVPDRFVKKLVSNNVHKFSSDFFKYVGNDETFLLMADLSMKSVLYHCQQKNAKVIFFTAMDRLLGLNGCLGFDNLSWLEFVSEHKCKFAPMGHPLHDAHRLTADYILKNVNMFDD